jgi:MoxR-like ATPase
MSEAPDWRHPFTTIEDAIALFERHDYVADRALGLITKLAFDLGKPLLLEGEAGVGKTAVAKVLAAALDTPLIRLQCYEGLDAASTLYEWNHARQILHIRLAELEPGRRADLERSLYGEEFLLARPLLQAIRHPGPRPPVLLIDELDRADEEFEAFLLEILSDFQVTVPEAGTFTAVRAPCVVLTSNRTRELHDALKRRCLYLWIDYPDAERERAIIMRRIPALPAALAEAVARTMQGLRAIDFYKRPGIAEALDWARALLGLEVRELVPEVLLATAGVVLKYHDDIERLRALDLAAVIAGEPAASRPG